MAIPFALLFDSGNYMPAYVRVPHHQGVDFLHCACVRACVRARVCVVIKSTLLDASLHHLSKDVGGGRTTNFCTCVCEINS